MKRDPSPGRKFDITDPDQVERFESPHYEDFYANRVEMVIGQEDAILTFLHIVGERNNKVRCKTQCSVTVSFHQLRSIRDMLNRWVSDDDPKFRPIKSTGDEA